MKIDKKSVKQIKEAVSTRRSPQQERAKVTADLILQSAQKILTRDGASGLTLRSLTEECGMTKGAIYGQFSGISSVLYYLYIDRLDQEVSDARALLNSKEAEKGIDYLIERAFPTLIDRWATPYNIALEQAAKNDPNISVLINDGRKKILNMTVSYLRKNDFSQDKDQLVVIARYMMGITELAFDMANIDKLKAKSYIQDIGIMTVKNMLSTLKSDL